MTHSAEKTAHLSINSSIPLGTFPAAVFLLGRRGQRDMKALEREIETISAGCEGQQSEVVIKKEIERIKDAV